MSILPQNQIKPELLSVCALNPFHQHGSASRNYMFANHLGQTLVVDGSEERLIQSGLEREYGKYTFNVEMPVDGQILDIIERYGVQRSINGPSIDSSEIIVIYEDVNTNEVGMIRLPKFVSNHQYFGFRYKEQEAVGLISIGAFIPKGTVFLDSPNKTPNGGYKYGVNANIAYMTMPATSEDGIIIRKGFLDKLKFKTYETRVVEWGSGHFALNLYGDESNYKSFPDIGSIVREDGILMALRSNDKDELSVIEKGIDDTMRVDHTFDITYYANGAGGKVVDIKIDHNINGHNYAEIHRDIQPQQYDEYKRNYCNNVLAVYHKLKKRRGESLQLTPELSHFIVECKAVVDESTRKIKKLFRQVPLDTFRIEFTIEYELTPNIGGKLTDCAGGKI